MPEKNHSMRDREIKQRPAEVLPVGLSRGGFAGARF